MTTTKTPEVHPVADIFPKLGEDELRVLAADIKANGLRQPIVLDSEGRLLDGRNRLAACKRAKVEPDFEIYHGTDPELFILSANVRRRHLTTGQQAMVTAKVLAGMGKRKNGRWVRGSVPPTTSNSGSNGWGQRMADAGLVLDHYPGGVVEVMAGRTSLSEAVKSARVRASHERAERVATKAKETKAPANKPRTVQVTERPAPARKPRTVQVTETPATDPPPLRVVKSQVPESNDDSTDALIDRACALLEHADSKLRDVDLAALPAKLRRKLTTDLERFDKTIHWALDKLHGDTGDAS